MKIVISRKGFDSGCGGVPSPILPDGRLIPLPIPSSGDPHSYRDVRVNGVEIGKMVEDLTGSRISRSDRCHLDPDLDPRAEKRPDGWRPAFGQIGAAQSHLAKYSIGPGDLFLFFGWFRQVDLSRGRWYYLPDAPGVHVIYGWMRVERVCAVADGGEILLPYARHPHLHGRDHDLSNTLYLSQEQLGLEGIEGCGAGLFERFSSSRLLSDPGQEKRSVWRLPKWFHRDSGTTLSYHGEPTRWRKTRDACQLQSVARGQEFVLVPGDGQQALCWLQSLFAEKQK